MCRNAHKMGTALAWLNQQSHCVAFAGLAMETPVRRRRTCKGLGFECEEPVSPSPRALKRRLSDLESFTPTKVRRPGVKEAAPETQFSGTNFCFLFFFFWFGGPRKGLPQTGLPFFLQGH